ncbi:hypothetical protein [Desulfurobacterium sp.]
MFWAKLAVANPLIYVIFVVVVTAAVTATCYFRLPEYERTLSDKGVLAFALLAFISSGVIAFQTYRKANREVVSKLKELRAEWESIDWNTLEKYDRVKKVIQRNYLDYPEERIDDEDLRKWFKKMKTEIKENQWLEEGNEKDGAGW